MLCIHGSSGVGSRFQDRLFSFAGRVILTLRNGGVINRGIERANEQKKPSLGMA